MPEIELRRLTKRFGEHAAVNAIDLSAEQGEMLTLLGPSGCGKTTTLRMIAGLEEPDEGASGRIAHGLRRGHGIDMPPKMRGFGMVFQSYAIWPHMTVLKTSRILQVRHVEIERRELVEKYSISSDSAASKTGRRQDCPAVNNNASLLPGPWYSSRHCFCSTNR